jgi:hypothetical protein
MRSRKKLWLATAAAVVLLGSLAVCAGARPGQEGQGEGEGKDSPQPSLTIYNGNFAVVRQTLPLDLRAGVNEVQFTEVTGQLEPDSVMLRDPSGGRLLQVLEQNYRNDPVSPEMLLSLNEGKVLEFRTNRMENGQPVIVKGKVLRSGYAAGRSYAQPIVEVNGLLQFGLPGQPLFPELGNESILKPQLNWALRTDKPGAFDAEVAYITGGMTWHADYNVVAPEKGDTVDIVGWVTIDNQSGKAFDHARIKLMAGDVNKIQPATMKDARAYAQTVEVSAVAAPVVTEKAFDEFHLYTLERAVTLHDHETKQVEFVTAQGVASQRLYVYDGAQIPQYYGWSYDNIRNDHNYGTQSNPKIWVMQEFKNTAANHLGMPLPKGRLRFYRRDNDGRLEFTGENEIDHTPKDETVRVYTGNAFDVVGERKRMDYKINIDQMWADESFEIHVRNHKKEAVEVRVVEHLYRGPNWLIKVKSDDYRKLDANTVEFPVKIKADGEAVVTYTVHYSWN